MSITAKAITALGFMEALSGIFVAAVCGDPSPAVAGTYLGALTVIGGIALDEMDSKESQLVPVENTPVPRI